MSARVPLQQIRGPGCGDGAANVRNARELLGTELAALVGESYERAYGDMVRVQQLTELEEVIRYSQLDADCAPPPPLCCCGRCCCGGGRSPLANGSTVASSPLCFLSEMHVYLHIRFTALVVTRFFTSSTAAYVNWAKLDAEELIYKTNPELLIFFLFWSLGGHSI